LTLIDRILGISESNPDALGFLETANLDKENHAKSEAQS
jgi:hypothetical protein